MIFKTTSVDHEYFIPTKEPVIANSNSNEPILFYEGISFKQKGKLFRKNFRKDSLIPVPINDFFKVAIRLKLIGFEIKSLKKDKFGFYFKVQSKQGSVYLKKNKYGYFWGASLVHNNYKIIPVSTVDEVLSLTNQTNYARNIYY